VKTVLCYGDSNTYGYDVESAGRFPREVRWPGVCRERLGPGFEVLEEGLNGRTTCWDDPYTDGRNGRRYLAPCLRSHAPLDLVVLMLGTNDLKAIFRVDPPEIASGVASLVDVIRVSSAGPDGRPPRILVVAPAPLGEVTRRSALWGFGLAVERSRQLSAHVATVAELTGADFLDAGAVASVTPTDGVHLDAAGHRGLGTAVADRVRTLLG
jgi:lysophospholipase L1-like esterase